MMLNGAFYNELMELNIHLYDGISDFKEYKLVDSFSDKSGVQIGVYQKAEQFIFAIRGTEVISKDIIKDGSADIAIYLRQIPEQYKQAETFYQKIKDNYRNLLFTGYSLGGSIAQMLGAKYGNDTVTYQAIGTKTLQAPIHTTNIINFGNTLDCFFVSKIGVQIGKIYVMPITKYHEVYPKGVPQPFWHWYPNFGKPSEAVEYDLIRHRAVTYIKDGIIPSVKDKINSLEKPVSNAYAKLKNLK